VGGHVPVPAFTRDPSLKQPHAVAGTRPPTS
jgi:hypothetical protein